MFVDVRALSFVEMDVRWKHPFTAVIAGPSQSGKSSFVFRFITAIDRMMVPAPQEIQYCFSEYQSVFDEHKNVKFIEGLPDVSQFDGRRSTLLIIDDLMSETNDGIEKIFTKISHHRNVSIMYLSQNLFYKSKQNRTMSLNTHYMVLFKNPRDANQVATLARQMYPGRSKFLLEAFKDATAKAYGYLVVDLKPSTPEEYRVRTCIFPDDVRHYVYIPR